MEEMMEEYVTFHVTAKDGSDVEMAVVDEFDFEEKHYVVGAVVLCQDLVQIKMRSSAC